MTTAQADEVFRETTLPRWEKDTATVFATGDLSPRSFGALVSLCFNRGTSLSGPRRREMLQIRDALKAGRPGEVPDYIRAMKRLWIGKRVDGLLRRRDAEAAMFQKGLKDS